MLMEVIMKHPDLTGLRRFMLATRDAHTLYEKYRFTKLQNPDRIMEITIPNPYSESTDQRIA
jgi:hypothetical protein